MHAAAGTQCGFPHLPALCFVCVSFKLTWLQDMWLWSGLHCQGVCSTNHNTSYCACMIGAKPQCTQRRKPVTRGRHWPAGRTVHMMHETLLELGYVFASGKNIHSVHHEAT